MNAERTWVSNRWLGTAAWEALAYAGCFLVGAGLRFFHLALQPLSPLEAANAWPAWLEATGQSASGAHASTSALLYTLHSALFWIAGGSDGLARLLPALLGACLVLLPWFWRGWIGQAAALWLALLWAIDPWLVALSRLADGAMLSLFLGQLVLVCLIRLAQEQPAGDRRAWAGVGAVSLGLLLVSGPLAWSWLPVLALGAWWFTWPALRQAEPGSLPRTRTLLAWAAIAAVLGATGWLARLGGLADVGASLGAWARQWTAADGGYPLSWLWLRLLVDAPFLLVFGAIGLVWLVRSRQPTDVQGGRTHRWGWFLAVWLTWGLVFAFGPGRSPFVLPMLAFPLSFAAAFAASRVTAQRVDDGAWREMGVVVAVLVVLLVSGSFWSTALLAANRFDLTAALTSVLIALLVLLLIVMLGVWSGWRQAAWLAGAFGGVLLLAVTGAAAVQLNHVDDPMLPNGFFAVNTSPEVRILAADVATLSAQRTGDAGEMPVQVQMNAQPDPVLGWYLRSMRRLDWVLAPAVQTGQERAPLAVVDDAETARVQLPDGYIGSRYAVRTQWLPSALWPESAAMMEINQELPFLDRVEQRLDRWWGSGAQAVLRWIVQRKVTQPPTTMNVVLWAPTE